jgi:hypothetical protein
MNRHSVQNERPARIRRAARILGSARIPGSVGSPRRTLALALVCATLLAPHQALAYDTGPYVGAAVNWMSFEDDPFDIDLTLGSATFFGGYRFSPNFGIEGTFRTGVRDDSVGNVKVGIDNYFSAAAIARLPITFNVSLYGTVGYGRASFSVRNFGTFAESDIMYGAGAQFIVSNVLVRAGYERLLSTGDILLQGFTVGLVFEL